ncbi:MAG: protein-L-isoaspartate(D-aspartate) O-methyltransferase [Propionivibrio sp.]
MINARDPEISLLLDEVRAEVRCTRDLTGRASLDERVYAALRRVPRHAFLPDDLRWAAYRNTALPIGYRQTISQPYVVALMTDLLEPKAGDAILEVGTGSGYQAAILSCLVRQVYSLEIVEELAIQARDRLQRLGFGNIEVRAGNGHHGWPEHAPYDSIIVTAAAPSVPAALIAQLKPGGTLVIPVGNRYTGQDLKVLRKDEEGGIEERSVLPVIFVPLTGNPETPVFPP